MTREEAVQAFYKNMYEVDQGPFSNKEKDMKWARKAILTYEVLGLLKFDEVLTPEAVIAFNFEAVGAIKPNNRALEVVNHLARCGYKIVREIK